MGQTFKETAPVIYQEHSNDQRQPEDKMTPDYTEYEVQRRVMIEYLLVMVARSDWHGVADAAMDLREMEAERKREQR